MLWLSLYVYARPTLYGGVEEKMAETEKQSRIGSENPGHEEDTKLTLTQSPSANLKNSDAWPTSTRKCAS